MHINSKNIFGAAVGLAIGALAYVNARDNYGVVEDKFSGFVKKVFDGIMGKFKKSRF